MEDKDIYSVVQRCNTPIYIYDRSIVRRQIKRIKENFFGEGRLFYSMKANPLKEIVSLVREEGCGVEVASIGEMKLALRCGFSKELIMFTSPGKTREELLFSIQRDVGIINAESIEELQEINRVAEANNKVVDVIIRINPISQSVRAGLIMSGKVSQFGIDEENINKEFFYSIKKLRRVRIIGIHVYMASQILDANCILSNTKEIFDLVLRVKETLNIDVKIIGIGGGFGVKYFKNENELNLLMLKNGAVNLREKYKKYINFTNIVFESGRFLTAESGVFVTKILYIKESRGKKFFICDGGMNFHASSAFLGRYVRNNFPMHILNKTNIECEKVTICGPLCTPHDILGQDVSIPRDVVVGDYVVIEKSGAYGYTYSPTLFLGHERINEIVWNK